MIHFNFNTLQHICKKSQKYALQYTATHCNILQQHTSTATNCSTLVKILESQLYGHFMKHCNILQQHTSTATYCNNTLATATHCNTRPFHETLQHTATTHFNCNILQQHTSTATHCNTRPFHETHFAMNSFWKKIPSPMFFLSAAILGNATVTATRTRPAIGVFVGLFWCVCRALWCISNAFFVCLSAAILDNTIFSATRTRPAKGLFVGLCWCICRAFLVYL